MLERALCQARIKRSVREWKRAMLTASAVAALTAFSISFYFTSPVNAVLISAICAGAAYAIAHRYPFLKAKARAGRVERELPLALRSMATQLSIRLPFEKCLESVASGYGELSREVRYCLADLAQGSSMHSALGGMARRVDSRMVRRAVGQLGLAYERGINSTALKKLADELVSLQKALAREYSEKMVVYSLVFVGLSAVFPALFQIYIIVGSSFMTLPIGELEALLIPVLAFPLLDIAVLALIIYGRPACA